MPPRFVPTLTEVVHGSGYAATQEPDRKPGTADSEAIEIELVRRVMQRVDLVLERRLREAVGHLILAHTQAMGSRLREEIELVVRESVCQAVRQELPVTLCKNE